MRHSDPELLAMMAMDDADVPSFAPDHLAECGACHSELASLQRVAEIARSGGPDDALGAPSPAVWSRISAELGLRADVAPLAPPVDAGRSWHADAAGPGAAGADAAGAGTAGADTAGADTAGADTAVTDAAVTDAADAGASGARHAEPVRRPRDRSSGRARRHARRRPWSGVLAAAAALVLVVGGIALLMQPRGTGEVLATAQLDPLPGWNGASGDAALERSGDGERDIRVRVDAAAAGADDYREVWLLSEDASELISLGVLDGDEGRFSLPDGVTLSDYPLVDVSREQLDGDPSHSGDSIVRGALDL